MPCLRQTALTAFAAPVSQTAAFVVYDDGSGRAAYTGLAQAARQGAQLLYATDFRNGKVDVFDGIFRKITIAGGFVDPTLPAGYAPFGIQAVTLNGATVLFVTYAQRATDSTRQVNGAGLGLVNIFDSSGMLLSHFVPADDSVPENLFVEAARKTFSGKIIAGRDLLEL